MAEDFTLRVTVKDDKSFDPSKDKPSFENLFESLPDLKELFKGLGNSEVESNKESSGLASSATKGLMAGAATLAAPALGGVPLVFDLFSGLELMGSAVGTVTDALESLSEAIPEMIDKLKPYSATLTRTEEQLKAKNELRYLKKAQESSEQLADFMTASDRFSTVLEDIRYSISTTLVPLFTTGLEMISASFQAIHDLFSALYRFITEGFIADLVKEISSLPIIRDIIKTLKTILDYLPKDNEKRNDIEQELDAWLQLEFNRNFNPKRKNRK